ncbi:MAG TPA: isopeptide-forming domain-containing fimbrial protein [Gemmataceae bacterium]|nr:isopeptide-forming domain-containing fimbrial protein [Gemmataceae bacterium]
MKSLAAQQAVAVVTDTGYPGPTPGDTLEYTVTVQASDFFAFDQVVLTDVLSDGQRYDSSFTPTLQVNGNGFTLAAAAIASANYTVTPRYSDPPDGNPNDGTDGTTSLVFRISDELISRGQNGRLLGGLVNPSGGWVAAPGDGPTTFTVQFRAVIQEAYTDAYSSPNHVVKQGDALTASGDVTGRLLSITDFAPTGATVSDSHAAGTQVPRSILQTSIYAVNGDTNLPAFVTAGDTITYRILYTTSTSDLRDLVLTDHLPPPVFHAQTLTTLDYTSSATPPPVGTARLGPTDTFHLYYPSIVPTLSRNTANGNNAVIFTYGSNSDPSDRPATIDLLFTLPLGGQPFPDGWWLTNLAQAAEANSAAAVFTQAAISRTLLTEPAIPRITKGVVSTSNPNGVFSPAEVGPTGVTFGAPGSSPGFSGTITSAGLASRPVNSDLSNVDAGDLVRFAIVIENVGRGPYGAFDVQVRDTLPAGFVIPASGLNLSVTDGTGAPFTYTDLGGGLFGSGIELGDPGPTSTPPGSLDPGRDPAGTTLNTGRNIAVITYDLQVVDAITAQNLTNTATLLRYASLEGGPSFVDSWPVDTATVVVGPWPAKQVVATGRDFTTGSNLVIGEEVTYRVTMTVPEGTTTNARLTDTLPDGLAVVSLDSLTASAAVTTSVSGGFAAVLDNARALLAEPGRTVTLDFGTLTNSDRSNAAVGGTLTNTLTYGYDTNGSLTSRTATTGGSLTQIWDVRGRLQSATDVQGGTTKQALYRYDPDGIRLREEVTTTTGGVTATEVRLLVVDHQSPAGYAEVIEERTDSDLIVASYVYGAGLDPISLARSGQPVGLYLADGHSGVRQVMDLAAAVLAAYRYDAFGNLVAQAPQPGGFVNPVGYRGERLDPVLGQYYLRARPYHPPTGRFTAMDPFPSFTTEPATLHKYLYAIADPISNVDPSGNSPLGTVKVSIVIIVTIAALAYGLGVRWWTRGVYYTTRTATGQGGPDFTNRLKGIEQYIRTSIRNNPALRQALYDDFSDPKKFSWDISKLAAQSVSTASDPNHRGMLSDGTRTVTINGKVYPQEEVNYYIYGIWASEIGQDLSIAEFNLWAHRVYNYGGTGTPGRAAWLRAGYFSDLNLPAPYAIQGATPSDEVYTKRVFFQIGAGRLSGTLMEDGTVIPNALVPD